MFASLFSQALLLCKKEMIYRDAGVAVRQALSGNITDTEVGLHPEHYDRLDLDLDPSTAVFDRWRLYRIHHFAVVADRWSDLSKQVTTRGGRIWYFNIEYFEACLHRDPRECGQDALDCADGKQEKHHKHFCNLQKQKIDYAVIL